MIDLSIIIVNYNVKAYLANLLSSIKKASAGINLEVFVVDNASVDKSIEYLQPRFPWVKFIKNVHNVGFGRANNQVLNYLTGKYTLILNPDTLIQEDTLSTMLSFMDSHPDAGLATCRLLNSDGSYSRDAIRNVPNLWSALMRVLGITELFPNSKLAGSYFVAKNDPGKIVEVPVISGSFMMIPTALFQELGGFDERFFMYFEDTDLCFRVAEKGFKIYYVPDTSIIHFRGESTKKQSINHHLVFNKALYQFYQKHYSKSYSVFSRALILLGIVFRALFTYTKSIISSSTHSIIDLLVLNLIIVVSFIYRYDLSMFSIMQDYKAEYFAINVMASLFYISIGAHYSIYKSQKNSIVALLKTMFFTFSGVALVTFFLKSFAFSRLIILVGAVIGFVALSTLRIIRKRRQKQHQAGSQLHSTRLLLVGVNNQTKALIQKIRKEIDWNYEIVGIVADKDSVQESHIEGVQVIGDLQSIAEIVRIFKIDEVFFQAQALNNQQILQLLSALPSNIYARLVSDSMDFILGKTNVHYFDGLPVINVELNYQKMYNQVIKRVFDLTISSIILLIGAPMYFFLKRENQQKELTLVKDYRDPIRLSLPVNASKYVLFYSLILHVFRGKLSMIGAPILSDNQTLERNLPYYKYGLTGLRQENEYRLEHESEKQQYEVYYYQNYAIWLDIELMVKALLNGFKRVKELVTALQGRLTV